MRGNTTILSIRIAVLAGTLLCAAAGPALAQHHNEHDPRALAEDPRLAPGQIAPVLEGLGPVHMAVSTDVERAQQFFDQGLALTYGFNHQEALRAFKEAARLDPDLGMAYWGWALVLGPNLNLPMQADVVAQAHAAVGMAMDHREGASEKERMLIEALARRYTDDPEADRAPFDAAYAEAMKAIYEKYPDDPHVGTLYAASLMNLSPWNYWTPEGRPKRNTAELVRVLEHAIEQDHTHTGALHYYIHAVEPVDAHRGVAAADLLRELAPGAGHLMHMPSHIYMQVGRYAEAFDSNTRAVDADEGYITQCRAQGMYPLSYYPHNIHFLAWAAILQGRSAEALDAARKVAGAVPTDHHGDVWALYQSFLSFPLHTMVRFGMWDEILAEPQPPKSSAYWTAVWHYARGLALLHTGSLKAVRKELSALDKIANDPGAAETFVGFSDAQRLSKLAFEQLSGEVAAHQGKWIEAIGHLSNAVLLEDSGLYNEPPDWPTPARHTLGAILLEAGRPREAETVYWQDLRLRNDNPYALFGLMQSLRAQGRSDEAAEIETRFKAAWAAADTRLTDSRF